MSAPTPIAGQVIASFLEGIADPEVFSGGGSVAAIAGAGAAATALLVMRLNVRRKANAARRDAIQAAVERTESIARELYAAADADIATLDRLLEAQRELKAGGAEQHYVAALEAAARSPLVVGELLHELLAIVDEQLAIATRFTVSDLGAAAVLAGGACRAALLTAEVNIALLRERPSADGERIDAIEQRRATILREVIASAERIEQKSRVAIHGLETKERPAT